MLPDQPIKSHGSTATMIPRSAVHRIQRDRDHDEGREAKAADDVICLDHMLPETSLRDLGMCWTALTIHKLL